MATDTTCNETDRSSDEASDESAAERTPGAPRPPRPASRKSSGRVAIPMPPSHPRLEQLEGEGDDVTADAAPAVDIEDERESPESSPARGRVTLPSGRRVAHFAEEAAAERAPAAPLTPRAGRSGSPGPDTPRLSLSECDGLELDEDPEPTIVGKVSPDLLGLSSVDQENTRAFTAPRELIELARRQREEKRGRSARDQRETARPPGGGAPSGAARAEPFSAPAVPIEDLSAAEDAPSVGERSPREPQDSSASGWPAPGSVSPRSAALSSAAPGPPQPASAPPVSASPGSVEVPVSSMFHARERASTPASEPLPSGADFRPRGMRNFWLALFLFLLAGVLIARWHELARLLP